MECMLTLRNFYAEDTEKTKEGLRQSVGKGLSSGIARTSRTSALGSPPNHPPMANFFS